MRTDPRPTEAQFKALGPSVQRRHLKILDTNGNPLTKEAIAEIRAARIKRRKSLKRTRPATVINGKSHAQESAGISASPSAPKGTRR